MQSSAMRAGEAERSRRGEAERRAGNSGNALKSARESLVRERKRENNGEKTEERTRRERERGKGKTNEDDGKVYFARV